MTFFNAIVIHIIVIFFCEILIRPAELTATSWNGSFKVNWMPGSGMKVN